MVIQVYEADSFARPGTGTVNGIRPHRVQPDEMAYSLNMRPFAGNWVMRGGCVQQGTAPASAKVTWLFHAYDTTGGSLVVRMAMINTSLYYKVGAGAWTSFKAGLTAGTYPVAVAYKDTVYWCNATDTPLAISIANPPVASNWTTLPSGINPAWVVLHKNRLYYGGDTSTPQQVWMTDPGAPSTTTATNVYNVPDDQNGNFPKIAVNVGNGIGLFCQDFLCYLTGTGPLTHQIYQLPRGAACVAWRSVVDMGEFGAYFLTENGVFSWDGNSPPIPVDPFRRFNWTDIDMTTETNIWAFRVGDEYRLYFKSKGDTFATTATAASVLASSTARTRFAVLAAARTRLTRVAFSTAGTISHYVAYDCRLKQYSLHTGAHLCGAWTQYRYGDTQDPWVGSVAADGAVYMADQISAFTDASQGTGSSTIVCYLKTGTIGHYASRTRIHRIKALFGVGFTADSDVLIRVWQDGTQGEPQPPAAEKTVRLGLTGEVNGYEGQWTDAVPVDETMNYTGQIGYFPQVEYTYSGSGPFEFRGHTIYYEAQED